jgi:hypothetical protein
VRDDRYNRFIVKAMNAMGYDAVTMGEIELRRGVPYVRRLVDQFEAKVVVSNVRPREGESPWEETAVVKVGDKQVGILGLVSTDFGQGPAAFSDSGWVVEDPFVVSERLVPKLKKKSDLVVALAHLENKDLERFVREAAGIDLVVAGYNPSTVVNQPEDAATTILRPGMRGEFLGFARLGPPAAEGKRTADLEAIMLKMADYPEDPALAAELAQVKADIEADRRKAQLERELADSEGPILGQDRYLGNEACARCHLDDYEWWKSAPHARAMATLAADGRDTDESCLPCHVTGFGAPGGYRSVGTTADMSAVQCEACHGMGTLHDWTGKTSVEANEATCRTCHTQEWSPDFDYRTYMKQLGHGS